MAVFIPSTTTTFEPVAPNNYYLARSNTIFETSDHAVVFGAATDGSSFTIAGEVATTDATSHGVFVNGTGVSIKVLESGIVTGAGSASFGMFLNSSKNDLTVSGSVFGQAGGLFLSGDAEATSEVVITSTGVVQGGSQTGDADGDGAAIINSATSAKITNFGSIIGDLNQETSNRVAFLDVDGFVSVPDPNSDNSTQVNNAGFILGDLELLRGIDIVINSGRIEGNVDLGRGRDL